MRITPLITQMSQGKRLGGAAGLFPAAAPETDVGNGFPSMLTKAYARRPLDGRLSQFRRATHSAAAMSGRLFKESVPS